MNIELFTAFLLITVVLIIVPGPIVTLVISTGATRGVRAALTMMGLAVRNAGAAKNILAGVINASAVAIFVFSRDVHWLQALITAIGASFGGWVGALMLSRVDEKLLKLAVVALGATRTIGLFWIAP